MKKPTTENEKKIDKTFDKKESKKKEKHLKNQHGYETNNQKIIADLKIKLKEVEDKLLRELAENENLRKRHEKESQENLKYAIRNFSSELLSVTDNFQRALSSIPRENLGENVMLKNLVIGLEAVEKEIYEIFERNGVVRFESLEKKFNPELHQAVSKNSDKPEGTIIEELAKGFMIGERLLRPAMVVVSSGKNQEEKVNYNC